MEKSKRGYSGFRPDIVAALANREFMRVLDVGCGEGKLGAQLKVLNPATVVCGVDGDEELLVKAEANLDFCWKVDLSADNWMESLRDQSFDLIIFADVLEHLPAPDQVLTQSLSLLESGGQVITCLPNVRHWSTFFNLAVKGSWPANERGIFDKTHLHFFARKNIISLLEEAGLSVVRERRNVRLVEPWSWTNYPGKLLDWWPFRGFFTFQYIHVCEICPVPMLATDIADQVKNNAD